MKNTIKTLTLATMVVFTSLSADAQTNWSLTGNNLSTTSPPLPQLKLGTLDPSAISFITDNVERFTLTADGKLGTKNPLDLTLITNNVDRLTLTANGRLGLGTLIPDGRQEIRYCPTAGNSENGLVITLDNCTQPSHNTTLSMFDVIGTGWDVINPTGENSPVFTSPINYLTGNITNIATPLLVNSSPLLWVRQEYPLGRYPQNSGMPEYETNFIVMPDGSCGVNVAQPRAAMDIRGSNKANYPAAIIGARSIGYNSFGNSGLPQYHTQQVQFIPTLKANGYNQISKNGDQGMFFTDGKGENATGTKDGSNENGAFILAPWAAQGNSDVGGMRMDANGNTEFHGTLRATKVNVDAKWWADFVFDTDYELMGLGELEQFIQTNKHLPNVPSEAEVLEEGLDLANMQAIQQQKIEELTLYIIQQQKQIDLLMQTVTELTK